MSLSSLSSPVLSAADYENFFAHGFVHLTNCFDTAPGSIAHRWVQESWLRTGLSPDDPSTWPNDKIHLPNVESVPVQEFSPKAFAAICELCGGEDRVDTTQTWGNGFIANYGIGRDKDWIPPGPKAEKWHVDGDWFHHFLDGPEQGLLIVVLFSDIHPKGGGTFIACDSVAPIARFLAERPEGVDPDGFPIRKTIDGCRDFRETTGEAGDVFLLQPFMVHASSYNHRPEARFMNNPSAVLNHPMRLDRRSDGSAYSPLEKSVLNVLGKEHFAFTPTTPRRRIVPKRIAVQEALLAQERERLAALKA